MLTSTASTSAATESRRVSGDWKWEGSGIVALAGMVVYFLAISWRRWADPIVDSGPQLYNTWLVSQGARVYHDFIWNYGPLSISFNALLFKLFGPGMMVLETANLIIYGLILALAYAAFRMAWGRLAAFAASAVFISVFSFSRLCDIANYTYAFPYTHETTHGMLLILVAAFVAVRWCRKASRGFAFALGLCGGVAAVLKPEFMLACAVLGMAALVLRLVQRQRIEWAEWLLIVAGVVLPTLVFSFWFARNESWSAAMIDACQTWWLVLMDHARGGALIHQPNFTGFDHPWQNALLEFNATFTALVVTCAIWAAGWFANRPWSLVVRAGTVMATCVLVWFSHFDRGWFEAGRCLPGITLIVMIVLIVRLRGELREAGRFEESTLMALTLVLLAAAMLVRMPLRARVYHFGFVQAALAGMVAAAVMVTEPVRWVGPGLWGRRVAIVGPLMVLAVGCFSIGALSVSHHEDSTEEIALGRDRFYASNKLINESGAIDNWALEQLKTVPPQATLLMLPEGFMINYLSRHISPQPDLTGDETRFVSRLRQAPPDYVIYINEDLSEFGITRYGAPGNPGSLIFQWLRENYEIAASRGGHQDVPGDRKRAFFFRQKPLASPRASQ